MKKTIKYLAAIFTLISISSCKKMENQTPGNDFLRSTNELRKSIRKDMIIKESVFPLIMHEKLISVSYYDSTAIVALVDSLNDLHLITILQK